MQMCCMWERDQSCLLCRCAVCGKGLKAVCYRCVEWGKGIQAVCYIFAECEEGIKAVLCADVLYVGKLSTTDLFNGVEV